MEGDEVLIPHVTRSMRKAALVHPHFRILPMGDLVCRVCPM